MSEKQRIDNRFICIKQNPNQKNTKLKLKSTYCNLGAMFAMDPKMGPAESSSNTSDEDFVIHHKKSKN